MASMRILLRPTLMLACLLAFTVADAGVLRSDGGAFVDAGNGTVVLRGFNLSQHHKFPPFRPNTDPALFTRLTAAGINVVRHQFNWEAFEPEPGVHDESYLDHYAGVTERAAAAGLYVIVDIHQDAFSRWTLDGCGEGFPRWAIPAGFAQDESDNGLKCYAWPLRVMWHRARYEQLFNDFYTPGNPARERYLLMLERIAQRLAGQPNVVGYEPINEPLGDGRLLMAFYADAIEVVRRHDPTAIAFLTPEIFTGLGTEATTLPIPPFGNVAFAPHYYDPPVYAYLWFGRRYEPVAANNRAVAQRWNAALLLGEFGAATTRRAPTPHARRARTGIWSSTPKRAAPPTPGNTIPDAAPPKSACRPA